MITNKVLSGVAPIMDQKKLYDFMLIKAGLLAEGIYFPDELLNKLREEQKVTEGTGLFRYGDQKIAPNEIRIITGEKAYRVEVRQKNNPELTNFSINQEGDTIRLEDKLSGLSFPVDFPSLPSYMNEVTTSGKPMRNVMKPMGPDFLRLYPDMRCDYAQGEDRCNFCGGTYQFNVQDITDILETLQQAKQEMAINGVFMSTGAFTDKERTEFYSEVLNALRSELSDAQIVFALAPQTNKEHVEMLYKAGSPNIMLSYNMEAFDKNRWDSEFDLCLGIGKAKTGREFYFEAYDIAVDIGGRGNHKSNFVIGLENIDSLKQGADYLAQRGIFSSGTVYYPTPGSIWETRMKNEPDFFPLVQEFRDATSRRVFIVDSYLTIGNSAIDQGLNVPWTKESRISGLEWQAREYLLKR